MRTTVIAGLVGAAIGFLSLTAPASAAPANGAAIGQAADTASISQQVRYKRHHRGYRHHRWYRHHHWYRRLHHGRYWHCNRWGRCWWRWR